MYLWVEQVCCCMLLISSIFHHSLTHPLFFSPRLSLSSLSSQRTPLMLKQKNLPEKSLKNVTSINSYKQYSKYFISGVIFFLCACFLNRNFLRTFQDSQLISFIKGLLQSSSIYSLTHAPATGTAPTSTSTPTIVTTSVPTPTAIISTDTAGTVTHS